MYNAIPHNATTHYQTSFRVKDPDDKMRKHLMDTVFEWVLTKEGDPEFASGLIDFCFRRYWPNLYKTHSAIFTDTFNSKQGNAWALRYREVDRDVGRKRFWYSDIGLRKMGSEVIASVRISYAWNDEDLSADREPPATTVPRVVRLMMEGHHVFSGRPEFRLVGRPIHFGKVGMGKALSDFIQSADRKYPLIVFNGDRPEMVEEANRLAWELTGKSVVALVAPDVELAEEIRLFLPQDYRIPRERFRVFFPFKTKLNSPIRHRWYDITSEDYGNERQGIVSGLLRNHSLLEKDAVESVDDIKWLASRDELMKLKAASPEQQKQLDEFLEEHTRVATERDNYRGEAASYATEVDRLESEVGRLEWRCKDYQSRLDAVGGNASAVDVSKLLPSLPGNLLQVAEAAGRFFNRLVITKNALESAEDYANCQSIYEAWEMLRHLNETMCHLKYEDDSPKDLEKAFKEKTGYDLALCEGKLTQKDKKLMRLRTLVHEGKEYDITPHLKHQNNEPKSVRIYFAFDEDAKKIIVGHIGQHIPNATTKML